MSAWNLPPGCTEDEISKHFGYESKEFTVRFKGSSRFWHMEWVKDYEEAVDLATDMRQEGYEVEILNDIGEDIWSDGREV